MKSEPKYRKVLNQDGWMVKLQRLCFGGATPKFSGYCPFFWFTWFCLLFFVILFPGRLLIRGFLGSISAIAELRSRKPLRPKDELLLSFYDHLLETVQILGTMEIALQWERENNQKVFGKVFDWIDKTPDWENCAKEAVLRRELKTSLAEERLIRNRERAKKISSLAVWFGRILKPIVVIVGLLISYKIGRMLMFFVGQITWKELVISAKWVIYIFALTAAVTLIINAVRFSVIWYRRCPKCPEKVPWYKKMFRPIGGFFGNVFDFIGDTIETIYTRECPLIEWDDHSEPIQTRD